MKKLILTLTLLVICSATFTASAMFYPNYKVAVLATTLVKDNQDGTTLVPALPDKWQPYIMMSLVYANGQNYYSNPIPFNKDQKGTNCIVLIVYDKRQINPTNNAKYIGHGTGSSKNDPRYIAVTGDNKSVWNLTDDYYVDADYTPQGLKAKPMDASYDNDDNDGNPANQ
jgi:hypothetical protein